MAHEKNNDVTPATIPLLPNHPDASAEPISLPQVFAIGADAVSYLLTEQPPLTSFSIARLITAHQRLIHLHLAAVVVQNDPQDLLRVLGILMRD
jgi:hypothetical protein